MPTLVRNGSVVLEESAEIRKMGNHKVFPVTVSLIERMSLVVTYISGQSGI